MRFMLPNKHKNSAGFTLVEIMIIAPIVIIAISGFVALMMSMVGDVLITRDRNAMTYDLQSALDRIEADVNLSTEFLTTSDTLESPQGSNNNFTGTEPFTNGDGSTLILSSVVTDENPASSTRWLVYYANQPNECGSQQTYNRIFLMKTIYFIKDGALWRRTVIPDFNTNTSSPDANTICPTTTEGIWQQNSCSPGYSTGTRCQTNDEQLLANVSNMSVSYFLEPGDQTPVAASEAEDAQTIEVTLSGHQTTVGQDVDATGSLRATRLNNIDNSLPAPPTPSLTYTLSGPASAQFSWTKIPIANSYEITYNINGGASTTVTVGADTLSYTVDAVRNDTITFQVVAKNVAGDSEPATLTATMPAWTTLDLQNNWVPYGGSWATPAFTRTSDGIVVLKGLMKSGSTATDTIIGNLPEGYRPSSRLIFLGSTYTSGGGDWNSGQARLAIFPNGDLVSSETNATWYSIDGIAFMPDGTGTSWSTPTFQNGWSNYGGTWQTLRIGQDSNTRVHVQGVIKQGTYTSNTVIATIPASFLPSEYLLFSGKVNLTAGGYGTFGANTNGIVARGKSSSYLATQAIYYPSSYTGWNTLTLQNGWVQYSSTYAAPRYTKGSDGIVKLKGLIKDGSVTNGSVIATLPAGYRPKEDQIFVVTRQNNYGRIDVQSDGDVVVRYVSSTWTALDDITFIADQ